MDQEIIEKTEKLVKGIGIPSQPRVIMEIDEEVKKEDPDFGIISNLVSRDVAMSAKIMKVCNSPLFGLRHKVESVDKALSILGLNNFKKMPDALKSNPSVVALEEDLYESNDCIAGSLVAKSWGMPETVCISIRNHHNMDVKAIDNIEARRLLAVLILTESIIYNKDSKVSEVFHIFNYNIGRENYGSLMFELDFTDDDISDIEDAVEGILDMAAEM